MSIFLTVKDDLIQRETDKAILVKFIESVNQMKLIESETQEHLVKHTKLNVKEIWIPKSIINQDWKESGRIKVPHWFYEENF